MKKLSVSGLKRLADQTKASEEAIQKLKELQITQDYEAGHANADDVLCELLTALGHQDVVQEFKKVGK